MTLWKQLWICVLLIITKKKKYDICISRTIFRDYWILADLIRIQYPTHQLKRLQIQSAACNAPNAFWTPYWKKSRNINVRNHDFWDLSECISETFISMRIDAECNEPLPRSHSIESMKILRFSRKWRQNDDMYVYKNTHTHIYAPKAHHEKSRNNKSEYLVRGFLKCG